LAGLTLPQKERKDITGKGKKRGQEEGGDGTGIRKDFKIVLRAKRDGISFLDLLRGEA